MYTEAVPEDSPPGKLIMQVLATDADIRSNAEITYTLHGTGVEEFRLSPDTGRIQLTSKLMTFFESLIACNVQEHLLIDEKGS